TRSKRDWSSDVCSSDLEGRTSRNRVFFPPGIHIFPLGIHIVWTDRQCGGPVTHLSSSFYPQLSNRCSIGGLWCLRWCAMKSSEKIGRASCRERVERVMC